MADMAERIADFLVDDHVALMAQLRIRCERNTVLHLALHEALADKPGWRDRAYRLLMSTAYLSLEENLMAEIVGTDKMPPLASNEPMKCVDCGSKEAKWRNVGFLYGMPTHMKLCDGCAEEFQEKCK